MRGSFKTDLFEPYQCSERVPVRIHYENMAGDQPIKEHPQS